jgi:hypothetical protein
MLLGRGNKSVLTTLKIAPRDAILINRSLVEACMHDLQGLENAMTDVSQSKRVIIANAFILKTHEYHARPKFEGTFGGPQYEVSSLGRPYTLYYA